MRTLGLLLLATVSLFSASASAAEACPYLADFVRLRASLPGMAPARAARSLERYSASHENPEACESFEIDRRLDILESQLFTWVQDGRRVQPHAVYRCDVFNRTTAQCRSPMEDDTAHVMESRVMPLEVRAATRFDVSSRRTGTSLLGMYVISMEDALDGKEATRLFRRDGHFTVPSLGGSFAVMAIFKTDGPWRHRKAVWYLKQ